MISLPNLPLAFRALFSCFLVLIGTGYLTALTLLFLADVQPHEKQGLSLVQAISVTYHGQPKVSRLEAALNGPMAGMVFGEERSRLLNWIHEGGPIKGYPQVEPVFRERCISCHSTASRLSIPPLTRYEEIQNLLQTDLGLTAAQLARVSHVHLFGISIIFLITGAIFALSDISVKVRVLVVTVPYLSIIMDIGSWWGTRYLDPLFAYIVIAGGVLMGLALAAQILTSLWQMWAAPLKAAFESIGDGHRMARRHTA